MRDYKVLVYEPSIRVPLILRGPGIPPGVRVNTLVGNVHLAPTIIDAAGVVPGRVVDGRSLLPLVQRFAAWPQRELLIENRYMHADFDAIRTGRFLYAEYLNGQKELYDFRRDPHQLRSQHANPEYRRARLRLARRLAALRVCNGPTC